MIKTGYLASLKTKAKQYFYKVWNYGGCSMYTILVTSDCAQLRPCLVLPLALVVLQSVQDAIATHCAVQANTTTTANGACVDQKKRSDTM
eukprot:14616-Heterococcus_DN1.PRE.15